MVHINLPADVEYILNSLENAGYAAYIVGGCVRDSLMGKVPHDWDICTDALPIQVKECFSGLRIVDTGLKHGTVTLMLNSEAYEVTTFRKDGKYLDGRRPSKISFVPKLKTDLSRRDFTINAVAYSPSAGIQDYFGGVADIKRGIIRCVGNPNRRFKEDGLRLMRGLRFASVLNFNIETRTSRSIHKHKQLLTKVSKERIQTELYKLLLGSNVKQILLEYSDILIQIIPQIRCCVGFQQFNPHHYLQVWEHTVESVSQSVADRYVRLTMLLHDIGKPDAFTLDSDGIGHFYGHPERGAAIAEAILNNLKCDRDTVDIVTELVQSHDLDIAPTSRSVRKCLNKFGEEQFRRLLSVKWADAMGQVDPSAKLKQIFLISLKLDEILEKQQCFSLKDLAIDGHDVITEFATTGKTVGVMLHAALDAVIEDLVANTKVALIAFLKEKFDL